MVSRMAWRSAGGGKPTYSVLSKRPGRSTAGSMMSRRENNRHDDYVIIMNKCSCLWALLIQRPSWFLTLADWGNLVLLDWKFKENQGSSYSSSYYCDKNQNLNLTCNLCSDPIIIKVISLQPGNYFTAKPSHTCRASDYGLFAMPRMQSTALCFWQEHICHTPAVLQQFNNSSSAD